MSQGSVKVNKKIDILANVTIIRSDIDPVAKAYPDEAARVTL